MSLSKDIYFWTKRLFLVLILPLSVISSGAQERNAARLVLEDTTYVDVRLGVSGATGRLKDVFTPERTIGGVLEAASRRKLGKVSLSGQFAYGYDYGQGSTWRGWIDPYETPFMVADSVPGNLSLERYAMCSGIGYPLGGGWSAGIDLAYDVTLMAKHKDLRNKNTAMTFRVAPGINWQGGVLGLGLDAGYERSTERVEYIQVSESRENMLFDLYGLWLYHGSGFSSAENRRMKERNSFFGDFQTDLRFGPVRLHNNFRAQWQRGVQTEVGYNNLQHGIAQSWTWSDDLSLTLGEAHRVEASAAFSTMAGLRPLQRQELDPDSRIRVWVTYGDPVFCYWRRYHVERLSYTFGTTWRLSLGVENWGVEHSYTEYPHHFLQRIHTVTPTVSLLLPVGRRFAVQPLLGYARDYDSYTDVTSWQLAEPLLAQWDYWDGDNFLASLRMRWNSADGRTCVRAGYGLEASRASDADGFRHTVSLSLGFVF